VVATGAIATTEVWLLEGAGAITMHNACGNRDYHNTKKLWQQAQLPHLKFGCYKVQELSLHITSVAKKFAATPTSGRNLCICHAQGFVAVSQSIASHNECCNSIYLQHQKKVATCAIATFKLSLPICAFIMFFVWFHQIILQCN